MGDTYLPKPSAFESEIHPLHRLRLCNGDLALAGGRITYISSHAKPENYDPDKLLQMFIDRIKASVDTFGDQPLLYGSIITTAIAVLALLVSKVLRKAAAYPKLHKIYKELVRQNETIFAAEKEHNALEEKQGSQNGLNREKIEGRDNCPIIYTNILLYPLYGNLQRIMVQF